MRTWLCWGAFAVGAGLMLVPGESLAEESAVEQRMLVLAQPFYGSVGAVAGSAEYAVSPSVALQGTVQGTVYFDDNQYADTGAGFTTNRWNVGVDPGVHFYLAGRAPQGLWVGPHVELSVLHHETVSDVSAPEGGFVPVTAGWRTLQYGGSLRAGYTAVLSQGLALQAGLGFALRHQRSTSFTPTSPEGPVPGLGTLSEQHSWSFSPIMTLGVGWAL